ncbi:unnamed protein product [Notodromas monacha]|uniref:Aspartate/homoserine dehydrogenase NAD-binding domain-containing protein n=1 Tax=Notodromas monacha TaxID=399045 RepID=A0A7R9GJI5_9CRUS|nr:unnamed protein product [Notodromas monacha]CAG0925019.1 unnamed protein product [Notodromas monacha]
MTQQRNTSGEYLCDRINQEESMEIGFVWNRSPEGAEKLAFKHRVPTVITDLERDLPQLLPKDERTSSNSNTSIHLVVEVAHPDVTRVIGGSVIKSGCNYFIGSPSVLADESVMRDLESASAQSGAKVYVPCGAFWGANDIGKMADLGTLSSLVITMRKHPSCLKIEELKVSRVIHHTQAKFAA